MAKKNRSRPPRSNPSNSGVQAEVVPAKRPIAWTAPRRLFGLVMLGVTCAILVSNEVRSRRTSQDGPEALLKEPPARSQSVSPSTVSVPPAAPRELAPPVRPPPPAAPPLLEQSATGSKPGKEISKANPIQSINKDSSTAGRSVKGVAKPETSGGAVKSQPAPSPGKVAATGTPGANGAPLPGKQNGGTIAQSGTGTNSMGNAKTGAPPPAPLPAPTALPSEEDYAKAARGFANSINPKTGYETVKIPPGQ